MLCSISIESSAASYVNIGTSSQTITASLGTIYVSGDTDIENVPPNTSLGTLGYTTIWGTSESFYTNIDFTFMVPITNWNNGVEYRIASDTDFLRFFIPISIRDTSSVSYTIVSGDRTGAGTISVLPQSVSASFLGKEYTCTKDFIDFMCPVESSEISVLDNTVLAVKVHCLVYGRYTGPTYSPGVNSYSAYMKAYPKIDVRFGVPDAYTIGLFEYAGSNISNSDLEDQTQQITDKIDSTNDKIDSTNEKLDEANETSKGIFASITEFFGSFFKNLIDSVISLFVPSADEMGELFNQLNQFFSDRFGFLYAPFDYMIRLMQVFLSSTGGTSLTFPGFSIMGYEVWPDLTYDLSEDPLVGQICGYVRIGTGILLAGYFIMYLQNFFKERFGSG